MATIAANHPRAGFPTDVSDSSLASMRFLVPIGRLLYSIIFILSGLSHFSSQTISYAQNQGVPMASFLVPFSGAMAVVGALMVVFGLKARWGALLLILFLIPVTFTMHNFWAVSDPMMSQIQKINFLKNLGLLGASFLIFYHGAGPISFDERHRDQAPV